jgi:hypothetical protein
MTATADPTTYTINGFPGLIYNINSGQILGTPTQNSSSVTFTVATQDGIGQTGTLRTFTLAVVDPPELRLITDLSTTVIKNYAPTSIKPVRVNPTYVGIGPYTYSIKTGTLPSGLTLTYTGANAGYITGTPTTTGTSTLVLTVVDNVSQSVDSSSFDIIVSDAPTLTTSLEIATRAVSKSTTITAFTPVTAAGGYLTRVFEISPSLPNGLLLNTSNGEITGNTNVITKLVSYTVTVRDQTTQSSSKSFTLRVEPPVLAATLTVPPTPLIKDITIQPFFILDTTGGYTPYTYVLKYTSNNTSATLPSGLTFNGSTSYVSGTPDQTSSATSYNIILTDDDGTTITKTFSLTVNPLPPLTSELNTTPTDYSNLIFYKSISITDLNISPMRITSGGYGNITFSLDKDLPAGLNFNPQNGTIYGTPENKFTVTSYVITAREFYFFMYSF